MWLRIFSIFLPLCMVCAKINLNPLEETYTIPMAGRVCAYADMNKDQYTDIIVHNDTDNTLTIMLQSRENLKFSEYTELSRIKLKSDVGLVYCVVADFNGDALPDIMVTSDTTDGSYQQPTIYIQSNKNHFSQVTPTPNVYFQEQPSVMDVNSDGIGDIVGFDKDGYFYCQAGIVNSRSFENCSHLFNHYSDKVRVPWKDFSPIFTDLTGDMSADIVFGVDVNGKLKFEAFSLSSLDDDPAWDYNDALSEKLALPNSLGSDPLEPNKLGNAVVADFDADGQIEILLPVCKEEDCKMVNRILMWTQKRGWVYFGLDLKELDIFNEEKSGRKDFLFRVGDFSLDGFPDLIVTIIQNGNTTPMILENVEYPDNANFSRKFDLMTGSRFVMPTEMANGKVKMSSFFDLKEDGNLDILVEYTLNGKSKFDFIKCDDKGDTTFLKVQIFTNICDKNCTRAAGADGFDKYDKGSGISWHGACAKFTTTDYLGHARLSAQCQLPQTSHRALYAPYVLFGLGRSPNFVDSLEFGVPRQTDHYGYQHHAMQQIVPNSRIIVIPPRGMNANWQIRLFLTPSSLIIQSLIVLASVCAGLLLIVVLLHWREKQHDKKERQAMSHRFHFDAM